jgi:hypothetical protein
MIEAALFFIGLAALVIKLFELLGEFNTLGTVKLPASAGNQPPSFAEQLLKALKELPARARESYLGRRLIDAIDTVMQRGSADGLADELKNLSDV